MAGGKLNDEENVDVSTFEIENVMWSSDRIPFVNWWFFIKTIVCLFFDTSCVGNNTLTSESKVLNLRNRKGFCLVS